MRKRRFEKGEGSSSEFWEIWIDDTSVHTHHGRSGAAGETSVKDLDDEEKAEKLCKKLIAEKTKAGFVEVATVVPKAKPVRVKPEPSAHDPAINRIVARARAANVTLSKGASAEALVSAEAALGQSLPEEVRAFYRRHDGAEDVEAVARRELLSLRRMVSEWKTWKDLLDAGSLAADADGEVSTGVQRKWWTPEWIPLTYDGEGNHHMLDLAPAPEGKHGQVLSFWQNGGARTLVAEGFLVWLESAPWGTAGADDADEDEDGDPPI